MNENENEKYIQFVDHFASVGSDSSKVKLAKENFERFKDTVEAMFNVITAAVATPEVKEKISENVDLSKDFAAYVGSGEEAGKWNSTRIKQYQQALDAETVQLKDWTNARLRNYHTFWTRVLSLPKDKLEAILETAVDQEQVQQLNEERKENPFPEEKSQITPEMVQHLVDATESAFQETVNQVGDITNSDVLGDKKKATVHSILDDLERYNSGSPSPDSNNNKITEQDIQDVFFSKPKDSSFTPEAVKVAPVDHEETSPPIKFVQPEIDFLNPVSPVSESKKQDFSLENFLYLSPDDLKNFPELAELQEDQEIVNAYNRIKSLRTAVQEKDTQLKELEEEKQALQKESETLNAERTNAVKKVADAETDLKNQERMKEEVMQKVKEQLIAMAKEEEAKAEADLSQKGKTYDETTKVVSGLEKANQGVREETNQLNDKAAKIIEEVERVRKQTELWQQYTSSETRRVK